MQNYNFELLNTDFNNIQDKKQLQSIILEFKAIIQNKMKQISQATSLRDRQNQSRSIILNRMKQNKINNENQILEFKNLIFSMNQDYERFLKQAQQQKQKNKKSIQTQHLYEMQQINKKIQQFQIQFKKLKQFQDLQASYISKIQLKKKELIIKQYKHHDSMNKEQSYQLKQNNQLTLKNQAQVIQVKKNSHNQAITKISSQVIQNQKQNVLLKSKLTSLQSELSKLKKQRNQIVSRRKELKINICLNEQELQEYKAVGSLQKAKIKAYKDKIQNLKIHISEEITKKQKTINDFKKEKQSKLYNLKAKLTGLQKEKEQMKLNMEKVKLLAQTILQQRLEVEEFFVTAMEHCKNEVQAYETNTFNQSATKSYGDKVDIDDLLPKDKQRILTNLYTKLAF